MTGYAYGPPYRITLPLMLRGTCGDRVGSASFAGSRRADSAWHRCLQPPLVRGADRIPEDGRFVVVANHYERPGLWMGWSALLISHVVQTRTSLETHWIAIQEWEAFSFWGIDIPRSADSVGVRARIFHVRHHRDAAV